MREKQYKGKRVLVVSQHFWPENFRINDIVAGFVEDGVEVDVLCGLPNYPTGEWYEGYSYRGPRRESYAGAEVFRSGEIPRKGNTNPRIFFNYTSFPLFALFSLPRLRKRRYDAIFSYETSPVLMIFPAVVAARLKKAPLTCYVLDLWPENLYPYLQVKSGVLRRLAQAVSDWLYRRCNRLIAMTDGQAKQLEKVTQSAKKRPQIVIIPQYCEDFYAQDIVDEQLSARHAEKFTILFAGNISPLQDLTNLVRAMRIVKDRGEQGIQVLIVGDGMSRQELEREIESSGLSDCFTFCGRCEPHEIPRWTGIADALFAGLADSENLGLTLPAKITSYFAAGRPLLVAANDEAARASKASGAALVSAAGDSEALAENILALVHMSEEERRKMGQNGRRCYREHYSRDLLLNQIQQVVLGDGVE
ncbi:glycosyltransferase family 4 protein [Ruminococcaceae bacterium OttesenSCG-928-I18]|nr:glycosyltransferase family 4 protein [Ruminococcaceae bacterium OttesenSCG-928-I18]